MLTKQNTIGNKSVLFIIFLSIIAFSTACLAQTQIQGEVLGKMGGKAPEEWWRLTEKGEKVEKAMLRPSAKIVGVIEGGQYKEMKFVAPDDGTEGLVMIQQPMAQNSPPKANRYKRGHLYQKEREGKPSMTGRAAWLGHDDYIYMENRKISMDGPGTIYRKGSIIDGKEIPTDMRLLSDGTLETVQ